MNPYFKYKDEVSYDYIIKAKLPIKLICDDKFSEDQADRFSENLAKALETDPVIYTEDYLNDYFPEVALGRVYVGLNSVDDGIEMYFGIVLQDAREEITLDNIKKGITNYMDNLNSNVEYDSSVYGYGDEEEAVYISFKPVIDKLEIDVIKQPASKTTENRITNIDKELVNEGKIQLRNNNDICKYILNDDGIIEQYLNENLINSFAFSKSGILNECKDLIEEGYLLEDNETDEDTLQDFNPDETEQNLQQGIEKVDKLQQLKDELVDKVDTLMNESKSDEKWIIRHTTLNKYLSDNDKNDFYYTKDINKAKTFNSYEDVFDFIERQSKFGNNGAENWEEEKLTEANDTIEEFPSTDYTNKILNSSEVLSLDLENDLTEEQKQWINKYLSSLDEIKESFIFLISLIDSQEKILSIDEYVNRLLKNTNL